jgi:hypothetical protein
VLEAEEILDGRWAQGEVVKSECHGGRTPGYLARDQGCATEDALACAGGAGVPEASSSNSSPTCGPTWCSATRRSGFPRTVPRHGAVHSEPQDPVSPYQWAQELEQLSGSAMGAAWRITSGGSKMRTGGNTWLSRLLDSIAHAGASFVPKQAPRNESSSCAFAFVTSARRFSRRWSSTGLPLLLLILCPDGKKVIG